MSNIFEVNRDRCIVCGYCQVHCKDNAVVFKGRRAYIIAENCTGCGECVYRCLGRAIVPAGTLPRSKVEPSEEDLIDTGPAEADLRVLYPGGFGEN